MKDVNSRNDDIVTNNAGPMLDALIHAIRKSGTADALFREGVKDLHNAYMEVFFGKGDRGGEPGTPLNPLYYDIVEHRKEHATAEASITAAILENPQALLTSEQQRQNGLEHPREM